VHAHIAQLADRFYAPWTVCLHILSLVMLMTNAVTMLTHVQNRNANTMQP